jgi:hypothetical protein
MYISRRTGNGVRGDANSRSTGRWGQVPAVGHDGSAAPI